MIGLKFKLRATFLANPGEERIQRVLLARISALSLRAGLTADGNYPPYPNSGYLCDMFLSLSLTFCQVKKWYRKAVLSVHPDKVKSVARI